MTHMSQATIVLPTRNRPKFLRRALRYLASVGCRLPVVVTDSSDAGYLSEVETACQEQARNLNLSIIHFPPALDFPEKIAASLEWVKTNYCVLLADDDFIVPSAIEKCVDFLEAHPDYVLAHGAAVSFRLAPGGDITGPIVELSSYPQMSQESSSGFERLFNHSCAYRTTFYSVHRLATMKEIWGASLDTDLEFRELIPTFLALSKGKSKRLDIFYMARQSHTASATTQLADKLTWLTTPRFGAGVLRLRKLLADSLAVELGGSESQRLAAVNSLFLMYLTDYLANQGGHKLLIEGYTGNERTYEPQPQDQRLEMTSLLRGPSPFFEDFFPIVTALMG